MTRPPALDVLVFYVPVDDTDRVLEAVFAAGAGAIGIYRDCAFVAPGTGQFRPLAGADPTIGTVGDLEHVPEHRVELVLARHLRADVVAALLGAHPYEEPAFHILETARVAGPEGPGDWTEGGDGARPAGLAPLARARPALPSSAPTGSPFDMT